MTQGWRKFGHTSSRILATAVALAVVLGSCLDASAQTYRTRALKVHVDGMVCDFCAQGLLKLFRDQKGVVDVQASFEDHAITIQLREDQPLSRETITELVKDAGFSVSKIEDAPPRT